MSAEIVNWKVCCGLAWGKQSDVHKYRGYFLAAWARPPRESDLKVGLYKNWVGDDGNERHRSG